MLRCFLLEVLNDPAILRMFFIAKADALLVGKENLQLPECRVLSRLHHILFPCYNVLCRIYLMLSHDRITEFQAVVSQADYLIADKYFVQHKQANGQQQEDNQVIIPGGSRCLYYCICIHRQHYYGDEQEKTK